ncbi:DUF2716 domain-containing protein [Streptomyces yangpuensis]|uniref:DUF2716 domain-containing protein n=1 Tax=Streptomyces yangpuensis TaxID=1648182 RepID=UPI0038111E94
MLVADTLTGARPRDTGQDPATGCITSATTSRRTGSPGRPPRPGPGTRPDGDYFLRLTADLRPGTFGNARERTLTVWGPYSSPSSEASRPSCSPEPVGRRNRNGPGSSSA